MSTQPFQTSDHAESIDTALKLSIIFVAKELLSNHAMTLVTAFDSYIGYIKLTSASEGSLERVGTPRWLLGQLSSQLEHHLAYTCKVKKHGTLLFRPGKELDALSHCLHLCSHQCSSKPEHIKVGTALNSKLQMQIKRAKSSASTLLNVEKEIKAIDPILWEFICILTATDTLESDEAARIKNLRRVFILHQVMFCMDSKCSTPFQLLHADLVNTYGGSAELLKLFNHLGVCVSLDTLKRHMQTTVTELTGKGLLQGLDTTKIILFTMDNLDFLFSFAQVFCGNQRLSSHCTTLQAIQPKPSIGHTQPSQPAASSKKRKHVLTEPLNGAVVPKRWCRARTGTERCSSHAQNSPEVTLEYNFVATSYNPSHSNLTLSAFRVTAEEDKHISLFVQHTTSYCLCKNAAPGDFVGFQTFYAVSEKVKAPEVARVKYIGVLDEVADTKETLLHVLSDLHCEYIRKEQNQFLVLEGDAKIFELIQTIKYEYGADLSWLIPYPGDWHLLKNYQICLMKPFFEAGLKDLAAATGYPVISLQHCTNFTRTHRFLMEAWEAIFRHMVDNFILGYKRKVDINHVIHSTLKELDKPEYDELALYSIVRSMEEMTTEMQFGEEFREYVEVMSANDNTWQFWSRFVFEDCMPYASLYIAIRSENWHLRLASLKSMAADFTAFDHPTYQKLISQHIVDVYTMPKLLLNYFEKGGFAVSISGRTLHSVGLDESHEMLVNKDIKEVTVHPSKDFLNRMAKYIPVRVLNVANAKSQYLGDEKSNATYTRILTPDHIALKSNANTTAMIQKIKDGNLLPSIVSGNRGLVNPYRNLTATDSQRHDLLNFRSIGLHHFEMRVKAHILKTPSAQVPLHKKKLLTFTSERRPSKNKVQSLQQELRKVQKCMRRKVAYANKMGSCVEVVGDQYIEHPRAQCDTEGQPLKGQKSVVTKYYTARYSSESLIIHSFPCNWQPESVIIEGMFLIHTKPLSSHATMNDYGSFLLRRFILPHFQKGSQEVHLLFDDPGRQQDNPKQFTQAYRDTILDHHVCHAFARNAKVPSKWQQLLKCRACKRGLTLFLSKHFTDNIRSQLQGGQKSVKAHPFTLFKSIVNT